MTLPRFYAVQRYWAAHPPTHLMVAAYLGIKPGTASGDPAGSFDDLVHWLGAAGQGAVIR